jgi:hypothetical protein
MEMENPEPETPASVDVHADFFAAFRVRIWNGQPEMPPKFPVR